MEAGAVGDGEAGRGECAEDIQAGGAGHRVGHIVVPGQQEDRDACLQQPSQSLGELALLGGIGVAGLIGVACEQEQVHALGDRPVHRDIQDMSEVGEAG